MNEQGSVGHMENSEKEHLKVLINKAWEDFNELAKAEEEANYEDEMISMDKVRAQGYVDGLRMAYQQIYKEEFKA
jgi:hypothetical protein